MRLFLMLILLLVPRLVWAAPLTSVTTASGMVTLTPQSHQPRDGTLALALDFALRPGWHIYWKNPGDVGYPPTVSAAAPVTLSPLNFPPPQFMEQDGLKNYILTGHVHLPFTARHMQGNSLKISADWLACSSQCVPEHANFTLPLSALPPATATHRPWWLLALLGGLILNLMPCVFPILAMKAMSITRLSGAAHNHIRLEALGYSAGILTSMAVLGGVLLGLRAAGMEVLWGFQFHSPVFVALMAWILLAAGLSMAGAFHLSMPGFVGRIPAQHSFSTGLLAVLVAAPCTAPFMGAALAAAFTMKFLPAMGLFLALGLGMALPILVLGFVPHLAASLPRPGKWMLWVQKILSIPLFISVLWLGWVLFDQTGLRGAGLLLLGVVVLLLTLPRRPILGFLVLLLIPFLHIVTEPARLGLPDSQPYAAATLTELQAQGRPVFIDLTAAWCITCQLNERTTLSSHTVQNLFKTDHVAVLVGDWTNRNPAITALLTRYHHAGVPLYLYFPPHGAAKILPQLLTPSIVETALQTP